MLLLWFPLNTFAGCNSEMSRAVSGISGSRVPDNRLGYPNPNFGSGTRNVALWEQLKADLTKKNVLLSAYLNVSVIQKLKNQFSVGFFFLSKIKINTTFQFVLHYIIKLQHILQSKYK